MILTVLSYIAALLGFSIGSGIIIHYTSTQYFKAEKFQKFKRQKPVKKLKREQIKKELKSEEKGYRHLHTIRQKVKEI